MFGDISIIGRVERLDDDVWDRTDRNSATIQLLQSVAVRGISQIGQSGGRTQRGAFTADAAALLQQMLPERGPTSRRPARRP